MAIEKIKLVDIADGKVPFPGGRWNVRSEEWSADPQIGPMVREITSVKWEKHRGGRWLFLHYKPEIMPNGRFDCGHSGWAVNHSEIGEKCIWR